MFANTANPHGAPCGDLVVSCQGKGVDEGAWAFFKKAWLKETSNSVTMRPPERGS
jgi:hypothetical protein